MRRADDSFFESVNPGIGRLRSRITAAATTEPASGPRPASSTPATSFAIEYSPLYNAPIESSLVTMSKNPKFVVVGASHPDDWYHDRYTTAGAFERMAPTDLHNQIAHQYPASGIHCLKSTRLAPFRLCATAVSVVTVLMIHDLDMIPEAAAKRCLSLAIFVQIFTQLAETRVRSLATMAERAA
jgi:hypothetical protein